MDEPNQHQAKLRRDGPESRQVIIDMLHARVVGIVVLPTDLYSLSELVTYSVMSREFSRSSMFLYEYVRSETGGFHSSRMNILFIVELIMPILGKT